MRLQSGEEVADELVARQDEAEGHEHDVGRVGVPPEAGGLPPETHEDEDARQGEDLADLDADVEGDKVASRLSRESSKSCSLVARPTP